MKKRVKKKKPLFKQKRVKGSILNKLKKRFAGKIFTLKEARKCKVSPQLLSYYIKTNHLRRLSHGIYTFQDSVGFDFYSLLKEKLVSVPQAIVGLESALKIYGLTDEAPDVIHLIVPISNVPKRKLQDVKLYQMKDSIYKKHINIIKSIPVSSLERTIIDLLRFGYSISFVLSVFKESQKKKMPCHLGKIRKMASGYRVKEKVSRLLEVL